MTTGRSHMAFTEQVRAEWFLTIGCGFQQLMDSFHKLLISKGHEEEKNMKKRNKEVQVEKVQAE